MMIKNDMQLSRSRERIAEIRDDIDSLRRKYTGDQLAIRLSAMLDEIEELSSEINEYLELRDKTLEEAVTGPLRRPILLDNIGELLAKLRIAAGLTQEEMAEMLGWHQSNISRFENERYSSHNISKMLDFASALGVWIHVLPSLNEESTEPTVWDIGRAERFFFGRIEGDIGDKVTWERRRSVPIEIGVSMSSDAPINVLHKWSIAFLENRDALLEAVHPREVEDTSSTVDKFHFALERHMN